MITRFLGALQFLTIVPIRRSTATPGDSAFFFSLVGGLLGVSAAGVLYLFDSHLGRPLSALLSIGWLMAITGCLHEDGLADVADAFRAGRSREKIMQVLKDSLIGSYGAAHLAIVILLRWQAMVHCQVDAIRGLPGALALSRTALVVMAHITPPVGEGLGREFARGCSTPVAIAVSALAVALAFLSGWRIALVMTLVTALTVVITRMYFLRRLGGVNGDCLGATCLAVETANLMVLAWRSSI